MNEISRVWIESTFHSPTNFRIAVIQEGPTGDSRFFSKLSLEDASEVKDGDPADESAAVPISEEALVKLSQTLWDLGIRPRDALNHEEALKSLRSERDFLRLELNAALCCQRRTIEGSRVEELNDAD